MKSIKTIHIVVGFAIMAGSLFAANVDIDTLCPPRPETSAVFSGHYPRAVRSYREAASMACAYMTSLPAMKTLVDTGVPEQRYQHNAYVSKTHAAHIEAMLDWGANEPSNRETGLRFARASADYLLTQLEPSDAVLAHWPPTYGRIPLEYDPAIDGPSKPSMIGNEPEGAVKYRGQVMLIYPASVGSAFVAMYGATREGKYLAAAQGIAETYLRIRRSDNSWPLKVWLATGEEIGENTLVPTSVLGFFEDLYVATEESKWRVAADETFDWIVKHPLTDWNWDGQFEDIVPQSPYQNPTEHGACDVLMYILKRYPGDAQWLATARELLEFCEKRFVCWETPSNHPNWPTPSVLEQYSCFMPIDASAAKMIRAYMALYAATGDEVDLAKAQALANTITRVQKPSGRIPTFWEGTVTDSGVSSPTYDWLNCMQASVQALLLVPDEPSRDVMHCYVTLGGNGDYTLENPGGDLIHAAATVAVVSGDIIHVAAGTYETTDCIQLQPGVKLIGAGSDQTHIRRKVSGNNDRVIYVYGSGTEIRDLKVSGGYTIYQGGGICGADYAAFLVSNCVVENCSAKYQGGGVFRGTLRDCVVRHCNVFGQGYEGDGENRKYYYPPSAFEPTGGGVFGGTYYNCTIVSNSAVYGGGGIGGSGGSPEYAKIGQKNLLDSFVAHAYGCTIAENTSEHGAGCFGGFMGSVYLEDCSVVSNLAAGTSASVGGGVYCGILSNCFVMANGAACAGGGLRGCCAVDCEIVGNELVGYQNESAGGAGASVSSLLRCRVLENRSGMTFYGAGCRDCYATNCLVAGNSGQYGGAGFGGAFSCCTISNNTAVRPGAACYNSHTYNCVILDNRGSAFGVVVRGCHQGDLVYGNTCAERGVFCCEQGGTDLVAINCTIVSNHCTTGGDIGFASGCMTNCVVIGHAASDVRSVRAVVNSLFQSCDPSDASIQGAENCKINVNPEFESRIQPGEFPFRLTRNSPARNAALKFDWMDDAVDIAGNPRISQGVPDMGAFEFLPGGLILLVE